MKTLLYYLLCTAAIAVCVAAVANMLDWSIR
jgi:hypothetical protein